MKQPEDFSEVRETQVLVWALQKKVIEDLDMAALGALFYLWGYLKAACDSAERHIQRKWE